jgi:hypothetical protein
VEVWRSLRLKIFIIIMENHELDLDKYFTRLIELGNVIDSFSFIKQKVNQCIFVCYRLEIRERLRGESPVIDKWEGIFLRKRIELEKELERIERLKNRYDFENNEIFKMFSSEPILSYFFPTNKEIELIKIQRKRNLKENIEDFECRSFLNCNPKEEINNVTYCYSEFYKLGEPVQMSVLNVPRSVVWSNISLDLGTYDFIQHLKNEITKIENIEFETIQNSPKKKDNRRQRLDKIERHLEYARYFTRQINDFKNNRKTALNKTVDKYGVSIDTVKRAVKEYASKAI